MWVVSYNATFLLCYDLIEKFIPGTLASTVLDSINNNGLFIFLVSNLLTGFINMSINTLETSNRMAVIILIGYSLAWTLLALYLDKRRSTSSFRNIWNHTEMYIVGQLKN